MQELKALCEGGAVADAEVDRRFVEAVRRRNDFASRSGELARSLLASFVRPNHPEVAVVARESAERLGKATGSQEFAAFQAATSGEATQAVEASITAIYDALQLRQIAYSVPPPGWDYAREGQRIRDHGVVARAGLGTCMDTTVLMAAVVEHVGLHPVLVLVPGHIFVGYWRHDPSRGRGERPDWYPGTPVIDGSRAVQLVDGGWLGLIETTTFTAGSGVAAREARVIARQALTEHANDVQTAVIDVAAARRFGVSPLPTVQQRADGVTEVVEYRAGGAREREAVATVAPAMDTGTFARIVDDQPARYRTWKSSLFSLNATNALLNLGKGPGVQPLVLPPEGLGVLEDRLNEDVEFALRSGFDLPEVYRAREVYNAAQLEECEVLDHLSQRALFVQRFASTRAEPEPVAVSRTKFTAEIRSMIRRAKEAQDERGMNPLFLCIGTLRWPYKPGASAAAPLILVPVKITARRGHAAFTLALDTAGQTTPNMALLEWLRREHGLAIPELAELATDRGGIDVDGTLAAVERAVAQRGLDLGIVREAHLALLDLSSFRMWQDLNRHAGTFLERPLVSHLVHTPTEEFVDAAAQGAERVSTEELEALETPIPADATQKTAVLWAREGRSFVLQGPPGTGKSQTITNMLAACVSAGKRVLFVAEKQTALSVVQRRLDAIGLAPFTLNLHHEGSNAAEVRAQLKRALTVRVSPDGVALENALRRLRNSRFELGRYPEHLHRTNAAGLSAYSAHDELLVLGDGPRVEIPAPVVAHGSERISTLRDVFASVQPLASAAALRPDHPWRLIGAPPAEPWSFDAAASVVGGVLDGSAWARGVAGPLRDALGAVERPEGLRAFVAASDPALPDGEVLARVLAPGWHGNVTSELTDAENAVSAWSDRLAGFRPEVLQLDLGGLAAAFEAATRSGMLGRGKRQAAALEPLQPFVLDGTPVAVVSAGSVLSTLLEAQRLAATAHARLSSLPGIHVEGTLNPFVPGALSAVRRQLERLAALTAPLRDSSGDVARAADLARQGHLRGHHDALAGYADAWSRMWSALGVTDDDFDVWRGGATLSVATARHEAVWRQQLEYERLLPLQRWVALVQHLEPLRANGLAAARDDLLEGRLPAHAAEEAFERGLAVTSKVERIAAEGLDRFDSVAHDERVRSYAQAEAEVRRQWVTSGPAGLLDQRGGRGAGQHTGGLARELEKTRNRLGTRAILRRYSDAVQEITPLVLASPSSAVDLIEPGSMDFDLVIFDEASQITVPEAVGAMGRARAVVVVGDKHQMPPTHRVGSQAAVDEDVDDPDAEEIVEDQESILSECELARVPALQLSWHYRSQDEALISFSNNAYYRGELSSFPTPSLLSLETGVELRRVDGRFIRTSSTEKRELRDGVTAGRGTNPEEALAIVDAITEILRDDPRRTIGVVTFNEQQRQLIADLLEKSNDAGVKAAMDESAMGPADVLFVKALEQVQGDERDVVLFSIAFSKQQNGKIPLNFGPLSRVGGERRLNVAVTRARRKNLVFCSFEPDELDAESASFRGVKDLKQFLFFARAAGRSGEVPEVPGRAAVRDRHRDEVAAALRGAGLHVMSDVGLSDFRLDLVLSRPESPERVVLPVLLDGPSWQQRQTVSDRDVLPVEVLRNLMGWPAVARIWWPMWLQNRDEVVQHVLAEFERAAASLEALAPQGPGSDPVPPAQPADDSSEDDSPEGPRVPVVSPLPPSGAVPAWLSPTPAVAGSAIASSSTTAPPVTVPDDASPVGATVFVPAASTVVGDLEVLDSLPQRRAVAAVREQILDIVQSEGPVELGRLVRIVGRRFGLQTVRANRVAAIQQVVPRVQVRKSRHGDFVWPQGVDPATWTGYRSADADMSRTLDEVAPEEIANAIRALVRDGRGTTDEELLRATAEVFGIVRLGANVRTRLEGVYSLHVR
ncbi:AAA domain-containing protein [Luteimicrobium subarcticum]|uniref:AAA domain-containing protein n=1 Tax=Luteimicrobium subarcticum TaxID=620910 RepID=UPI000C240BDF|nr:AAA domain-containing protein [Luteimicrobium subarcticum]